MWLIPPPYEDSIKHTEIMFLKRKDNMTSSEEILESYNGDGSERK